MNIQVTTVSKTDQKLSRTAAAVFVISRDDIRRSAATNIPDLLRMVPGMSVAQISANAWAITARGFNKRFANELLVMVDGRSGYSLTTGGVFWDVLDVPIEDIERIEVIRGPGGSIWGANAVHGVINIITKKAKETQGVMIVAASGTTEPSFDTLQYGGKLGSATHYRLYAKYFDVNRFSNPPGQAAADDWHVLRGGFRADYVHSAKDTITVEGDIYTGKEGVVTSLGPSLLAPGVSNAYNVGLSGGFLNGVWNHTQSERSDTSLQISFTTDKRQGVLRGERSTADVNFQHHFLWGNRQEMIWGLEDNYSQFRNHGDFFVTFSPSSIDTNLFSSFLQDEIALVPDRLYLIVGTKLEHNHYTGTNLMPSARVIWMPTLRQTLWASVSEAPRIPDDSDTSLRANFQTILNPAGPPTVLARFGNPQIGNEDMNAYEGGYRRALTKWASIDLAAFYNQHNRQKTTEPLAPFIETSPAPMHIVVPFEYQNLMYGESHGLEVAANWKVSGRWTLSPGYSFEKSHMHLRSGSQDMDSVSEAEGSTPVHSAQLRSQIVLPHRLSWDTSVYFSGRLTDPREPSNTRLDTQVSWEFKERSSFAIVGQNLLKDRHEEFVDSLGSVKTMLIKRSVFARFTIQF